MSYEKRRKDQKRRIEGQRERFAERREERDVRKKEVEKEDVVLEGKAKPDNAVGLQLAAMNDQINRKDGFMTKKSPDSVIAVFDLVRALNSYSGDIKPETDNARLYMMQQLDDKLVDFLNATGNGSYDPKKPTHQSALDEFEKGCTKVMKDSYKILAAEPSIWNVIKDLFNDCCKALGFKPKGNLIDSTLDSTDILKGREIRSKFADVQNKGIEIEADQDMENPLRPS